MKTKLPYSVFHDEDTNFDAVGNLKLGQDSRGLTCTTFAKVVLKGCYVDVLDDVGWPDEREEDVFWLNGMIKYYKENVKDLQKKRKLLTKEVKRETNYKIISLLKLKKTKISVKINKLNESIKDFIEGTESVFKRYRSEEFSASAYCSFSQFPIKFEYPPESPYEGAKIMGEKLLVLLPDSING